jgi:hypothetical protein
LADFLKNPVIHGLTGFFYDVVEISGLISAGVGMPCHNPD